MTEQRLLRILEGMVDDDVETFQWYLTLDILEGFEPIPKGLIDGAKRRNTVTAMVDRYLEEGAVSITIAILKKMNNHNAADKLKKETRVTRATATSASATGSSRAGAPPAARGASFVDTHRATLIQRVNMVASILDELLARGVITQEGYNLVMSKSTSQDQMRALYSGPLNASGPSGKDLFYEILVEKERYLVDDLNRP